MAPPEDKTVPPGSKGIALLTFGLYNPTGESALVNMVTVRLIDNDDHAAIDEVRLILDADGNGRADAGETILARLSEVPAEGMMQFDVEPSLTIAADDTTYFMVVVDFR